MDYATFVFVVHIVLFKSKVINRVYISTIIRVFNENSWIKLSRTNVKYTQG